MSAFRMNLTAFMKSFAFTLKVTLTTVSNSDT